MLFMGTIFFQGAKQSDCFKHQNKCPNLYTYMYTNIYKN